uniref:Fatty acid hydroxylase domain-containing protein n=1 Tax=Globodera pallida TaxID=36090 RepID=A0A183C875_GLOPA
MFALAFCAAPLSKNVSRLTYTKAEELCARETANRVKYCNLHNPTNLCICYTPAELVRDGTLLCPQLLRLDSLEYLVLTLSVAFPVPRGFLSDPDSIIAEDLELFTGFSQSNVLILRKGCSADRRSYVFQYAILRHAVNAAPFNDTDLRLIHPPMFKRFFLHQEGLTIARVVQSKFLLPLIGSTPAGQIYRKGQKLNGLGFCPLRDATQCYVGEMPPFIDPSAAVGQGGDGVFFSISPILLPHIQHVLFFELLHLRVPNYNIQVSAWWMILIFLEFTLLWLFGHSDRFALNDSMSSVFAGMLSQCFKFGGRAVAIFGYDLAYYVGHRAIHEAGFFWGLHTIHHSSEYYNFSTALRQAAIQDAGLAAYDILQAFVIPPPIFLVHRYFSEIFQFWMHTSLFGSLGPMGFVFNTPSHHRVHHGRNAYCIDRNFGGVLIIWDRMFGTFEAERKEEPPVYGLIRPERSFNQLWLQFHTLKELLCDKWRLKDEKGESVFPGWADKVKALFFPPGWLPKARVRLFFHWASLDDHTLGVPPVELPVQKYNPPLSPWLKAYCVGHFLLLLCIFLHFEYDRGQLGYVDFSLKIAFFVCTMQSFGAFFDKKKFALFLEIFRSIGVIAYYATRTIIERRGIQPNRIFMAALFAVSAIAFAVIPLRDLARKASKVTPKRAEPIGTVRKEFENGENGIAEVTDKTTETKRNGVGMDRTKRNDGVDMDRTKRNGVDMDRTKRNGVDMDGVDIDRTKRNDGVDMDRTKRNGVDMGMDRSGCWI